MSLISIPNVFTVGAVIVASQHNSNFSIIYSDYNGNITDANISASAAISDTKLGQLTTASKVSGASLTSLSSVPSGAGVIPTVNLGSGTANSTTVLFGDQTYKTSGFGSWVSKTVGTIYQAATDGFVCATSTAVAQVISLVGITDSSATPSTTRAFERATSGSSTNFISLTFPVKKSDYYQVTNGSDSAGTTTMFFISLGS